MHVLLPRVSHGPTARLRELNISGLLIFKKQSKQKPNQNNNTTRNNKKQNKEQKQEQIKENIVSDIGKNRTVRDIIFALYLILGYSFDKTLR